MSASGPRADFSFRREADVRRKVQFAECNARSRSLQSLPGGGVFQCVPCSALRSVWAC